MLFNLLVNCPTSKSNINSKPSSLFNNAHHVPHSQTNTYRHAHMRSDRSMDTHTYTYQQTHTDTQGTGQAPRAHKSTTCISTQTHSQTNTYRHAHNRAPVVHSEGDVMRFRRIRAPLWRCWHDEARVGSEQVLGLAFLGLQIEKGGMESTRRLYLRPR